MNDLLIQFFNWIGGLTFVDVAWLGAIIYFIHYAEEGPRLVHWFRHHYTGRAANKFHYTQAKLNLENGLLFIFGLVLIILLNMYPDSTVLLVMNFGAGIGFFGNFIFHASPTLRHNFYSPGVVTASLLFPPTLLIFIWKFAQLGMLTPFYVICSLLPGIIVLPLFVHLTHNVILRDK